MAGPCLRPIAKRNDVVAWSWRMHPGPVPNKQYITVKLSRPHQWKVLRRILPEQGSLMLRRQVHPGVDGAQGAGLVPAVQGALQRAADPQEAGRHPVRLPGRGERLPAPALPLVHRPPQGGRLCTPRLPCCAARSGGEAHGGFFFYSGLMAVLADPKTYIPVLRRWRRARRRCRRSPRASSRSARSPTRATGRTGRTSWSARTTSALRCVSAAVSACHAGRLSHEWQAPALEMQGLAFYDEPTNCAAAVARPGYGCLLAACSPAEPGRQNHSTLACAAVRLS